MHRHLGSTLRDHSSAGCTIKFCGFRTAGRIIEIDGTCGDSDVSQRMTFHHPSLVLRLPYDMLLAEWYRKGQM